MAMDDAGPTKVWKEPEGNSIGLFLNNSLTKSKVKFKTPKGRRVDWYICGPTVYDVSHMGHARTYVSCDIVRRILTDYFNYDVNYIMNVTDVDDKIIIRSNARSIPFTQLAREQEAAFFEDMKLLQVRPPNVVTRVTEYVPEIIAYIERIISNGFAYTANGSVYFDTVTFGNHPDHSYAKLQPLSVGDSSLLQDGEGALSDAGTSEKRSKNDFALWKKSKEGEPSWESPFGPGRPGWHIECSAMASDITGPVLDIHSGGVDLKFPHHDNEIAQSEAYFGSQQWVNYFLHVGHLDIDGRKMSKSLKNFISIKEALETFSWRQIRFLFLLHRFDAPMDYSPDTMDRAVTFDALFSNFFLNVKAALRSVPPHADEKPLPRDRDLMALLVAKKAAVHSALLDNINTPVAISELADLVRAANDYMSKQPIRAAILRSVATYVHHMFKVFGAVADVDLGFSTGDQANAEAILTPLLNAFSEFRDTVRTAARSNDAKAVLDACDTLRDDTLPPLGVRLEDSGAGPSVWKLDDAETLMRERARKKQAEEEKRAAKEAAKEAARKKQEEKDARAQVAPSQMFLAEKEKYSQFDDKGIPTHDAAGAALSKNARKAAEKEWQKQDKLHSEFLARTTAAASQSDPPSQTSG